jgi:hypothetical protein
MIECYKYSAPLALRSENIDSNDILLHIPQINCHYSWRRACSGSTFVARRAGM